jgi:murein DD-endopeptidase MepM/ murein hydrolase activator NlpD
MEKRGMFRNISILVVVLAVVFFATRSNLHFIQRQNTAPEPAPVQQPCKEICGTVKKGETLSDIFKKYRLDMGELFKLKEASADVHSLRYLYPGRTYRITVNDDNQINSFKYWMNDDNILNIWRSESGFSAEKKCVEYEKKMQYIGGVIKDNLVDAIGDGGENLKLALELSDIYAWDIDFNTDLRKGDQFRIAVEGLYLNGEFKKYGDILFAQFINQGQTYDAYRFIYNGKTSYFDSDGRSLRRSFLKAPLSFRRISSGFSEHRFHPILKIFRPHHGLDYAAPGGTPVSAVGDGTVVFTGYKGEYGKLIIIQHPNGWQTRYGHLSRIGKDIRRGKKVGQGQVVGYVGSTGLATGPHLHYEVRIHNKPVNPLTLKLPQGGSVPAAFLAEFRDLKNQMDSRIASITFQHFADAGKGKNNRL